MTLRKISLLICLILSFVMIFTLSSCGGDEPLSGDNNQSSTQAESSQSTGTTDSDKIEEKPEEVKTYTVTFVQEGFTDVVIEVKEGEALTDIPTPQAEEGYNVVWESVDLSSIKENLTVNAVKTVKTYTVTFVQEGFADIEITVNHGQPLTNVPTPQAVDGYNVSWEDIDLSNITADVIINALKTIKSYTIIFDSNGGTSVPAQSVGMYQKATEPAEPTRPGYVFDGWYYGKEKWSFVGFVVTEDMTLVAKWTPNENTIVFDANGGEGTMENMTVATDIKVNLTANAFTKAGYTFIGWSTTPDGAVEYTNGAEYTMGTESSYTLYAVWQANINGINFNANSGKGTMQGLELATGTKATLPANTFTRTGYTFLGWSTTPGGEVEYTDGAEYVMGTESSYTLYAVWQADVYTITYHDQGSKNVVEFTVNDLPITLSDLPNKTDYLFEHWYNTSDFSGSIITQITELQNVELFAKNVLGTDGLVFTNDSGSWTISGYTGSSTLVVIPSFYKGKAVTSIASFAFKDCTSLTSVEIPDSVTSIGNSALYNCTSLTSVEIPNSVTSIGYDAFSGCTSLTSVHIDDIANWCNISFNGSYANPLYYAKKLYLNGELVTDLLIPNTVDKINSYAFLGCTSLTSVEIGDSVTSIGNFAFENCTCLTSVVIGDSVTSIGYNAFYNCKSLTSVEIPDSVTSIGDCAFRNCTSLASVEIGDSVTSIGSYAFYYCTSLKSMEIPDSVTSIGDCAFRNCTSLASVEIGDSVTSIGNSAFCNCTSLTSVEIPNSVTSIGESAFSGCSSLASLTIPFVGGSANATNASASTLFGYIFGTSYTGGVSTKQYYAYSSYETYYIPKSLKTLTVTGGNILYGAFYNCTSLTSVVIGDSVRSIGSVAFRNCTSLTSVEIPDSVTSIGSYAFDSCTSLTSVVIPDSVTSIDDYAFYGCTSLTIYCEASSKPSGWYSNWNYLGGPVVWGYTGENQ